MDTTSIKDLVEDICSAAKKAKGELAGASTAKKNAVLSTLLELLIKNADDIIAANNTDLLNAEQNGVAPHMLDRLKLDLKRIESIADSLRSLIMLEDPIGSGTRTLRPNGLVIEHIRVPIGVVAIIYEARPNVTVDAAALCIKTGNACVLRGGKEAINTNKVLCNLMKQALEINGLPKEAVGLITVTDRESAKALMKMRGLVDLLLPRGSAGLIKSVVENATVPVIETGAGNCHLYVDKTADIDMAVKVALNAKLSRPAVCNAIETLLVHKAAAQSFLTSFKAALEGKKLELRGCEKTREIIDCLSATDEDYATEYDDYILALKVVEDIDEAIDHIGKYSTGHSESIITKDLNMAEKFQNSIDSAAVYVNASTRFTDGGEFGFGAELGISTQKLHARGPMGLFALTTGKYLITGNGQIR